MRHVPPWPHPASRIAQPASGSAQSVRRRTGRASAARTGPASQRQPTLPDRVRRGKQPDVAARVAHRPLVADPLRGPHLRDRRSRHDADDVRGRSNTRGKILWERSAPAEARPPVDKRNHPASPSAAVDRAGIYVFFQDYGLIAYDHAGARALEDAARPVQQHLRHGRLAGHRRRPGRARLRSTARARFCCPSTRARARSAGERRGPRPRAATRRRSCGAVRTGAIRFCCRVHSS